MQTTFLHKFLHLILALASTLIAGYQVQEDEITFHLYNSETYDLKLTKNNLCAVDRNRDIHFVLHGRSESRNISFVVEATEIYLEIGDYNHSLSVNLCYNVIQVDWSKLGAQPDYIPRDGSSDAGIKRSRKLEKSAS